MSNCLVKGLDTVDNDHQEEIDGLVPYKQVITTNLPRVVSVISLPR